MGYVKNIIIGSNTAHLIEPILYTTCNTGAEIAEKTALIDNFELVSGVTIQVRFLYENTSASPTLNISNTGAKTIYLYNDNLSPWNSGEVVSLTYDGTGSGAWYINNYNKVEVIRL